MGNTSINFRLLVCSIELHVNMKQWKRFKINKKRLKMAEKSNLTSFQVLQAPESWSKYTTSDLGSYMSRYLKMGMKLPFVL